MQPSTENEFGSKVLQQFMDLFVIPEQRRREENGLLPKTFELQSAQIIFYPDGRKPLVRLNSEIKAIAQVKLKAGVSKKAGELILDNEVDGMSEIELSEESDLDFGHATLVRLGNHWTISFDFRYNKTLARKHLTTARQFLDAATFSFNHKNWSAFADNLFSTCELLAKATLLVFPEPHFAKKATHRSIQMKYNRFADLGNAKIEYKKTLNKLSGLRDKARYLKSPFSLSEDEAAHLLQTAGDMIESIKKQLSPR
jgi:uncharacterized protein (UPF0332 family)